MNKAPKKEESIYLFLVDFTINAILISLCFIVVNFFIEESLRRTFKIILDEFFERIPFSRNPIISESTFMDSFLEIRGNIWFWVILSASFMITALISLYQKITGKSFSNKERISENFINRTLGILVFGSWNLFRFMFFATLFFYTGIFFIWVLTLLMNWFFSYNIENSFYGVWNIIILLVAMSWSYYRLINHHTKISSIQVTTEMTQKLTKTIWYSIAGLSVLFLLEYIWNILPWLLGQTRDVWLLAFYEIGKILNAIGESLTNKYNLIIFLLIILIAVVIHNNSKEKKN